MLYKGGSAIADRNKCKSSLTCQLQRFPNVPAMSWQPPRTPLWLLGKHCWHFLVKQNINIEFTAHCTCISDFERGANDRDENPLLLHVTNHLDLCCDQNQAFPITLHFKGGVNVVILTPLVSSATFTDKSVPEISTDQLSVWDSQQMWVNFHSKLYLFSPLRWATCESDHFYNGQQVFITPTSLKLNAQTCKCLTLLCNLCVTRCLPLRKININWPLPQVHPFLLWIIIALVYKE